MAPEVRVEGHADRLIRRLGEKGYCRRGLRGEPTGVGRYIHLTKAMIVRHFRTLAISLCHFYTGADNYRQMMWRILYITKHSCALTLARKLKFRTKAAIFRRFGPDLVMKEGGTGRVLASFPDSVVLEIPSGFKGEGQGGALLTPEQRIQRNLWRAGRTRELFQGSCQTCGDTRGLEVHHLRHLRKGAEPQRREGGPG